MLRRTRPWCWLAALPLALGSPAEAQVRLGRETGTEAQVPVISWWEIPFRSVVRQRYDFSCGSAALATLLTHHYHDPIDERQSFASMWKTGDRAAIRKQGFSLADMRSYLRSAGYRAEGFRLTTDQLLQLKRPVIVLLDLNGYKHFVVVKGAAHGMVLTGDPMLGLVKYGIGEFERHWNGIVLAIMSTPKQVRPNYNLASEWNPWATAPMGEAGMQQASIGDLTTFLPPEYQLTPSMLLDVRVGTVN